MQQHDVLVIGAGISGLSLAHFARDLGHTVAVLEAEGRVGGALHSPRPAADFWLELGGHTGYNSYGRLLGIVETLGLRERLQPRETARWMLWEDGHVHSVPGRLNWLELAVSLPRLAFLGRAGASVADYYGSVLGARNWARVGRPMLSAVASQDVSGFPADLLFKKRPRRKDLPRSYAIAGGWQTIAESIAGQGGLSVHTGAAVQRIERPGTAWRVTTAAGEVHESRVLALATPPDAAAQLLAEAAPEVAAEAAGIAVQRVESEGVVVRSGRVHLPRLAGLVGIGTPFYSVVTRDPVTHPDFRGFAFHFRPRTPDAERSACIAALLGIGPEAVEGRASAARTLPAPAVGHAARIRRVDAALAGRPLLVTGNWFAGLAMEDCVGRSWAEAERLQRLG